jgi:HK97 family phage major capsid protein
MPLFNTDAVNPDGTISANYLGFPVRFSGKPDVSTDLSTKAMLFFGNLAMASVIVERQQQTIMAISRERAFDADQILVRAVHSVATGHPMN